MLKLHFCHEFLRVSNRAEYHYISKFDSGSRFLKKPYYMQKSLDIYRHMNLLTLQGFSHDIPTV